jgi:hypothetical protein
MSKITPKYEAIVIDAGFSGVRSLWEIGNQVITKLAPVAEQLTTF